jgi:hypothetical protein
MNPENPPTLARCGYNRNKRFIWQLYATIRGHEYVAHIWSKRPSKKEVQDLMEKNIEKNWSDATGFRLAEGSTVTRGKWKRSNAEVWQNVGASDSATPKT